MTRIAIDRHLHVDVEIDSGRVTDARLSSTMFRGIETILKGRDPRDAWAFAQRICGACTTSHAIASVRAVENAVGAVPPPNARLLRNLIMATQTILVSTGMKETLERGDKVKVSGFGNFQVRHKKARIGRNPQTGKEIEISARRVLTFRPSQVLKAALNEGRVPEGDGPSAEDDDDAPDADDDDDEA